MIGRLFCALDRHAPEAGGVWNGGYCFTRCRRCGCDMVRSAFGEWHVPRNHRVVWAPPGDDRNHRIAGAPNWTPPVAEAEPQREEFERAERPEPVDVFEPVEDEVMQEAVEPDFDPVPPPPPPPPPRPTARIKPRTATLAPRPMPAAPSPTPSKPGPNRRGAPSSSTESGRSPFDFDDFDESPADPPGRSSSSRHAAR